jgi:predicted esterase
MYNPINLTDMKKILYFLLPFLLFASACTKDNVEPELKRGSVISYVGAGDFNVNTLESLFQIYLGGQSTGLNYQYNIKLFSVKYQTIDAEGNPVQASGLVVIPVATNSLPILSFAHGTILNANDVPSKMGSGYQAGMLFAAEGYVTTLADFVGLGSSEGLHPYMHAKSEATASIDMLRAARTICSEQGAYLDGRVFISGYSQGGHVALATQKYIESDYSDEFIIKACAPLSAPADLSGIMLDTLLMQKAYIEPSFLPYILFAYNPIYKMYSNLNDIFVSPYNSTLQNYFTAGTTFDLSAVSTILPASRVPTDILKPEILQDALSNANNPIRLALADNNLYDWTPKAPIYLIASAGDVTVPASNSQKAYDTFVKNGATKAQLYIDNGTLGHVDFVVPAIMKTLEWFDTFK